VLQVAGRWSFLTYFAGLGLGFILIEIVLLQRFVLFLGEPIYTFSVVLAGLLISTGAGSYLANGVQNVSRNVLSWSLLAVVAAILSTLFITPPVLALTLGLPSSLRVAVAFLLIAPLGVLLGVPFPTALRLIGKEASSMVSWAWAVNAFFTVIGSVLATILAMAFGFVAVHVVAAACYAVALLAIRTAPQKSSVNVPYSEQSEPTQVFANRVRAWL
jgi:predicted membrane-bound spermidine synthase